VLLGSDRVGPEPISSRLLLELLQLGLPLSQVKDDPTLVR